jgi:hypothetical protein
MLQAAAHENRADGMQKFFAQFKGKFLIGEDDIVIHGVIRKAVLPTTTCAIVSPHWKQTLRC